MLILNNRLEDIHFYLAFINIITLSKLIIQIIIQICAYMKTIMVFSLAPLDL